MTGFFLTKINKRILECSKQAVYSAIRLVLISTNQIVNTCSFWLDLGLSSGLACIVMDICLQLDEKKLDLEELRKSCLAEKNVQANPNPRHIINLVNYIHFLKSNPKHLYRSKLLLNKEVANQARFHYLIDYP